MTSFISNVLLALGWAALVGRMSLADFLVGFIIGFIMLAWLAPEYGPRHYARRGFQILHFVGFYFVDVVSSALRVAWDVVTPRARHRPAIVALPLTVRTDTELAFLANLVTFSPGSLALDVTPDRKIMFVHEMFAGDLARTKASLKRRFESWVLRLMR